MAPFDSKTHIPQLEHSISHRHPHFYNSDVVLDPGPSQPSFYDAAIVNGSTACVDKDLDSTIHFGCPNASQMQTSMDSRQQFSASPTFGPDLRGRQALPQGPKQEDFLLAQVYDSCWAHTSQTDVMINGATDMIDARNRKRNRGGEGSVNGDDYNQFVLGSIPVTATASVVGGSDAAQPVNFPFASFDRAGQGHLSQGSATGHAAYRHQSTPNVGYWNGYYCGPLVPVPVAVPVPVGRMHSHGVGHGCGSRRNVGGPSGCAHPQPHSMSNSRNLSSSSIYMQAHRCQLQQPVRPGSGYHHYRSEDSRHAPSSAVAQTRQGQGFYQCGCGRVGGGIGTRGGVWSGPGDFGHGPIRSVMNTSTSAPRDPVTEAQTDRLGAVTLGMHPTLASTSGSSSWSRHGTVSTSGVEDDSEVATEREMQNGVVPGATTSSAGSQFSQPELDAHIAQLDNGISTLIGYRSRVKQRRNMLFSGVVGRLPVEVLVMIFEMVCFWEGDEDSEVEVVGRRDVGRNVGSLRVAKRWRPLVFGWVCKRWRAVAWNASGLWTRLSLVLSNRPGEIEKGMGLAMHWVMRSRGRGMKIRLVEPVDEEYEACGWGVERTPPGVIAILAAHANRWETLDTFLPLSWMGVVSSVRFSLEMLTTLTLRASETSPSGVLSEGERGVFVDAPMLREVRLVGYGLGDVDLPWARLERFVGESLGLWECVEVLRRCERLKEGVFEQVDGGALFSPGGPVVGPIVNGNVEKLECLFDSCTEMTLEVLFGSVELSGLKDVVISLPDDTPVNGVGGPTLMGLGALRKMVQRSEARLRTIHLVGLVPDDSGYTPQIVQVLQDEGMKSVERLLVVSTDFEGRLGEEFVKACAFLEGLREFEYRGLVGFSIDAFLGWLERRREVLKSVRLVTPCWVRVEERERMRRLVEGGMEVFIGYE